MKKSLLIAASVLLLAVSALGFVVLSKPAASAPANVTVAATPERLARGQYLFENVANCADCHSERDPAKFSLWPKPGRTGVGFAFPVELGFPGTVVAPNITPDPETGIGTWTDGERIRAIREGVSKDGRALFPLMPYTHYREMSDEDLMSVVAYLKTIPPVKNRVARTQLDFPVNLLVRFEPQPAAGGVQAPDRSDKVKYGEYLVNAADCINCHTQADKGKLKPGLEFAGGREFNVGTFLVHSANITPDEASGIGSWSEDKFVAKFRGFANLTYQNAPATTQANFTLMPWSGYSHMTEEDLRAIYAYLRTLKPVYNPVEVHPPPQPVIN